MPARAATEEPELVGRRTEREALDQLVADVVAGKSRVVVLRGEAGVGKTALLHYLSERLAGWQVLTAVGVESEMELAYSSLHQLCAPILGHLGTLPVPQRDALSTVFGMSLGAPPDRFIVGLGVLTLFAEIAEQQPLACIVDDVQWLDQASAQILGFVGRRLLAERVALVGAARTGTGDDGMGGLPTFAIDGLDARDARSLLLASVHGPMDNAVLEQIIAESHGNPLALLELPRAWNAGALAGGFGVPDRLSVASRIENSYIERLVQLPADTRLLVLAAAAEPRGDLVLFHRAARVLGIDAAAITVAEEAGLLRVAGRVEFAHPLVRSAAYRAAPDDERRQVDRALAAATDAEADPDRRAWHRARAAEGTDDEIAVELVRSAGRAQARGGLAATAAFLTRATELTADPATRVQRALDAAYANLQAGRFDTARTLLATAAEGPAVELQRAWIDLLLGQLAFASSRGTEATPLLLAAARRLEPLNIEMARETYLDAFSAALFGARLNGTVGVPEVAQAARAAPPRTDGDATAADLLLNALVALDESYEIAVPRCRDALQKLLGDTISPQERLRWLWQGCVVSLEVWDDESAYHLSGQSVEIARKTGTLSELALALSARSPVLVLCGELSMAASAVTESQSVEDATGIRSAPYGDLILAAWRGRERVTVELIGRTVREAGSRGEGVGLAIAEYARAVLCNGLGRYDEALAAARSASEYEEVVAENWGLSELVEPAVRTGATEVAIDALDRLAVKAQASGTDWALGIEARSRAVLSEGDQAESYFRAAIEHLGQTRVRAELARAQLLYGEWLRREHRTMNARAQLRSAHDMFAEIGADAFAERARRELAATGEKVRKRTADEGHELTPQEEHIARLARDGRSNAEIGAELFISVRTVEWHLQKVFAKLGIRSRRDLRQALPASGRPLARA